MSVRLPPGRVLLDGEDISTLVRSVEVTRAFAVPGGQPERAPRARRLATREFATEYDVIAEGRDQGTVVFPDAYRKFFLTASLEERARRRHAEFANRGEPITLETVRLDLEERDARDAARAIAPMKPAADACLIDTTGLALDEVIARIEHDIHDRLQVSGDHDGHPVPGEVREPSEGRAGA